MTAHNKKHDIASTDNHDSLAAPNNLLQADANGLPVTTNLPSLRVANSLGTGILTGGVISVNANPMKFDISAGQGIVVLNQPDINNPTITEVSWSAMIGVTAVNIGVSLKTYLLINSSGNLIQQTSPITSLQRIQNIVLGELIHPSPFAGIVDIHNTQLVAYSEADRIHGIALAVGALNVQGNIYGPNGANMKMDKAAGKTYSCGANYSTSESNPNTHVDNPKTALDWVYFYQTAPGVFTAAGFLVDTVDATQYDDGTGLAAVPATKFTTQVIFYNTGDEETYIQYGQEIFDTLEQAEQRLLASVTIYDEFNNSNGYTLRCLLIVRGNATDLSDVAQAKFLCVGKFVGVTSGTAIGGGEVNTASNVGLAGVGPFKQKVGVDLEFKNMAPASAKVTVTENLVNSTLDFDVVTGGANGVAGLTAASVLPAAQFNDTSHGVRTTNAQHPDVVGGASGALTTAQHGSLTPVANAHAHSDLSGVSANQHHNQQHSLQSATDHTSTATPAQMLQADANGNPVDATNTNAQVSAAVTASHARLHSMTSASDHSAATQGNIPYAGAAGAWAVLAPGTSGYFLKTQGAGANPIWAVVAGGTGSTAEVFLSGCEYNANNGSYRTRTLPSTTAQRFTFRFPIDFGAVTKLVLIVIPGSSVVNKQYALASEYGAVGEASNINNQSATVTVASFTSSQIAEINLATVFTSAAANDYAGVLVTGQSGVAVSCDVLGVLLRYTRV